MNKKTRICVLMLGLMIAAVSGATAQKGAAKTYLVPAEATFRDFQGNQDKPEDQVKSDGKGPYYTIGNIACTMDQSTSATSRSEFQLSMNGAGKKQNRWLWFDLNHPTACVNPYPGLVGYNAICVRPDGYPVPTILPFSDFTASLVIPGLGNMPVISNLTDSHYRVAVPARFITSAGILGFQGQYYSNYWCSTNVVASRVARDHWIVTTDAAPGEQLPVQNQSYPNYVGNIAQLEPQLYSGFLGNYTMSFQISIYCPTCK